MMRINPRDCAEQTTRFCVTLKGIKGSLSQVNENMFVIKSCPLFSKLETRFSLIEMSEKIGKCRMFLGSTINNYPAKSRGISPDT